MSNKIEEALNIIQYKTGKSLEEIAETIGRTRPYLSVAKKKGTPENLLNRLKNFFPAELEGVINGNIPSINSNIHAISDTGNTESLESLIRSNENLTKANMDLSANLVILTKMLDASLNASKGSLLKSSTSRSELLELLSPLVKGSLGLEVVTDETAALELDRRLSDIEKRTAKVGKSAV